jgi:hypothetical protein
MGACQDLLINWAPTNRIKDEEEKKAKREEYFKTTAPPMFAFLVSFLVGSFLSHSASIV